MTKLTVSMRDQIVGNAIDKAGTTKALADLYAERRAWAEAVADESIGGAEVVAKLAEANKKVARVVASLPEDLRAELQVGPRVGSITAAFGGRRTTVREWVDYRPAKNGLMLAADHPLTIQFEQLENRSRELEDRRTVLRQEVRALVNSCSTVNKLLYRWTNSTPPSAFQHRSNTMHLQFDFESFSLKENAVLLALGACTFDPVTGDIKDTFYATIDPRTQPGRDISASTVLWWLEQSGEARNALVASTKAADTLESNPPEEGPELDELYATAAHSIHNVSRAFIAWYEQQGEIEGVWSNGAVDHGWLSSMFEYSGLKNPVPYRLQRDFRTLKALNPTVKHTFSGVAHNALDDAINQAAHMSAMWAKP